ncbi:30S ribosomal protein S13 [Candidatus Pacearchaeota archaeon]|nr:30S ribosomal protein S13 [Candidatus Pacearchaeota archaeon]
MKEENPKQAKEEKHAKTEEKHAKPVREEKNIRDTEAVIVRILSTDIPGSKSVYAGLTRIKGVSWSFANALCISLGIPRNKKVSEISEKEVERITDFIKNPKVPEFLLNRRKDRETGESKHLTGTELELRKEFDIKRIRKIKSYKGIRHILGQPVRGQRTKSHFRKNKTIGVTKKVVGKK